MLHEVLLQTNNRRGTLNDYLLSITAEGTITRRIDSTDSFGRSTLSWAVEYGWADAVAILVRFGANVNQCILSKMCGFLPLLHRALVGPTCGWSYGEF